MKDIVSLLNDHLLKQTFHDEEDPGVQLANSQLIAQMYARMENAVSVLSDLKADKSYVYYGGAATALGLPDAGTHKEIPSIWEKDIFDKVHPDDLLEKHTLELKFFHLVKDFSPAERRDYEIISRLRMQNNNGHYVPIEHRMFYIGNDKNGSIRLALCLYHFSRHMPDDKSYQGMIINTRSGEIVTPDKKAISNILSDREKDVLRLIKKGRQSKEIADLLTISVYTVNRHRQNILEKLQVSNSMEACRVAESMLLL